MYGYGTLTTVTGGDSLENQPLMTTAIFSNIHSDVDETLKLTVKTYAATVDVFDGDIGDPLSA